MFTSVISLRTANWIKWKKLFTDLLTLSIRSTYSLALFIRFGGNTHQIYLLDLFISFTYSLALFIRFGGFIYLPYLQALVSAYTVFILIANSVSFSHISESNNFTFFSIYISHVLMEKTSALHYVITLTNIASLHHILYTCPLIKLTNITSLNHDCYTRSISNLHHSNIISHCSESTHLIPSDI